MPPPRAQVRSGLLLPAGGRPQAPGATPSAGSPRDPAPAWAPRQGAAETRGDDFQADDTYAALLAGRRVANDGGVPDGTRQVVATALTVPVRGIAHAA